MYLITIKDEEEMNEITLKFYNIFNNMNEVFSFIKIIYEHSDDLIIEIAKINEEE